MSALGVWNQALLVAGLAEPFGEPPGPTLSRWNGLTWAPFDPVADLPGSTVHALADAGDAGTPRLLVGGRQMQPADAGGLLNRRAAVAWNGQAWEPLEQAFDGEIQALAQWDDGTGPALFIGGNFTTAAGRRISRLARWDGTELTQVGGGLAALPFNSAVLRALLSFDDGSGPALYLAGAFVTGGGQPVTNLARWNGAAFTPVGAADFLGVPVETLAVFNDGAGAALYVGGHFTRIQEGGVLRFGNGLASWNGQAWRLFPQIGRDGVTHLLPVERGPHRGLYVSGPSFRVSLPHSEFQLLGRNFARWNGTAFVHPGDFYTAFPFVSGGSAPLPEGIQSLAAVDGVDGPEVYVAARFQFSASEVAVRVARLRQDHWELLPDLPPDARLLHASSPGVEFSSLTAFDDGFGPQLYLATLVQVSTETEFTRHPVLRWNGTAWDFLLPPAGLRVQGNLLPGTVNGLPALLRASTPFSLFGRGVVSWGRLPCP